MTNMTGSKLSIFSHPRKITGYWITTTSFPYRGPYWPEVNMGLDFVSGQYECLFSRCQNYVINSLIHGHFHTDWLGYHPSTHIGPPLRLGPIWGSWDDNQANMEMPIY